MSLNLFRDFHKFWIEFEELTNKQEIKKLRDQYYKSYLEMGWRACWGFGTLACFFHIIFILLFRYISTDRSMIGFPFFALVILLVADQAIQRNRMQIEHIFFFYILFQGIIIAHESYQFNHDRFHEFGWFFILHF